ncbi:SusC/RagA family TonB-linked outer membrane protein [Flavobacterium pectinovorum]|uniref:Iron complex outermembrane recepter protein n=1 Tax=Flavobacterium pectinovorum TaxID=29533 RepID=A0AB36P4W6_9FLAO|nr:SusC/RagA family TonB-linked outer membrane protein [Flavobacterium pectinovorum]OXB07066.1 SusC/RagA family TonB-linked outer membrane protein [Flavobacterium pectinovorum]SHN14443.1 iron complex outermembrane recepter protein [Flavobacterium pectinovorum]
MKIIKTKFLLLLFLLPFCVLAQNTISGVVLEKGTKQPIPGVNIKVSGTNSSTSTDFDGKFQLSGVKADSKITFSYTGYTNQTIAVAGQKNITVSLEEDNNQLKEVVVQVGYGSVKKKDATGSVTALSTKDFNKGNNITTENLLNGRVAGLTVNSTGAPGSSSQIRIRGGSSLFASNDPLIVIDGLPLDNTTNTGASSFLASLNPATVESITVLKDASASAIYGSRASNGVIIITTKKGSKTLSVDYNVQYAAGTLIKTVDVLSADEFRGVIADRRSDDLDKLGTANTDWQKAIYRNTGTVDQSLAVRGSLFNIIPTSLTLGNTDQQGLRLTNNFKRNTVGLVMNPTFLDNHLKLRLSANYTNEINRFTDAVEGSAIGFDPTQPIKVDGAPYGGYFEYTTGVDANGNYPLVSTAARNPVSQLLNTNDRGTNDRIFGNFEIDYKFHFLPALRAVVNVGYDESNGDRRRLVGADAGSAPSNNNIPYGTNEYTEATRKNKLLDTYLVYNKTFNALNFEMTGGYSYQKFQSSKFETGNILNPDLPSTYPETTLDTDVVLLGFFARTNLNFRDKYLLTLSYRRDGSSRFEEANRWGNFPSVAFAWKIKEDFFKESTVLSDLKLRLSYGITGQQDIPEPNGYLQKYQLGGGNSEYYFGESPIPVALPSKRTNNLKWEETTSYNAGLDFGFLNNRLSAGLDVYYKESKDLLVNAAISDGSNFSNRVYQNVGSFTTKGVEFTLNANAVKTENFNWNMNFNIAKFERRIKNLVNGSDIFLGDNIAGTGTPGQIFREGYTPYSFYVYKQLYNNEGKPIEGAFADLNGDNIRNDEDKYIYNNPDPDFTLGFASNMNYKKFDFSFNLRASIGNRIYNAVDASRAQYDAMENGGVLSNVPSQITETNFQTTSNVVLSDLYIENASFLKMDNVTLGYTLNNWLNSKASLRISTGVQNVFVITKYSGLDPEITNNGVDKTIYPRQRSILFGLNLKF